MRLAHHRIEAVDQGLASPGVVLHDCRAFTLLDVTWSAMRLLSLVPGGLLVDEAGIEPLFWLGGALLSTAGMLGLLLLGGYDLRPRSWTESA
jgi:hypothetical protein